MFSSFSRGRDRDGGWLIYCVDCREPICRTTIPMGKMQCEICRRLANGEMVTSEMIRDYRLSKQSVMGVTMTNVSEGSGALLDQLRSMGNGFLKALGRIAGKELTEAEVVVQEKRRGRLFEQIDLEQLGDDDTPSVASLGTIHDIDAMFEREKHK